MVLTAPVAAGIAHQPTENTGSKTGDQQFNPSSQSRTAAQTATITGVVSKKEGTPAPNAWIIAVNTSAHAHAIINDSLYLHHDHPPVDLLRDLVAIPRPAGVYVTKTNATGHYTLAVPPGNYTLRALQDRPDDQGVSPDYLVHPQTITVQAGQSKMLNLTYGNVVLADCFCPAIEVSAPIGTPGQTIDVNISTDIGIGFGESKVASYQLVLTFDPSVVRPIRVDGADFGTPQSVTLDNRTGRIVISNSRATGLRRPTLARITFRIRATTPTETFLLLGDNTTLRAPDGAVITTQSLLSGKVLVHTDPLPVAEAGPDQVVLAGTNVTLNGSGSYDPAGESLTYRWRPVDTTDSLTLNRTATPTTSFTAPSDDESRYYSFELTVSDGQVMQRDTVLVAVEPSIDRVIAGRDDSVSLAELQQAIQLWANDKPVPNTGGKHLNRSVLQSLIDTWAKSGDID